MKWTPFRQVVQASIFFIIPFGLMAGRAGQAGTLYFFLFVLGTAFYFKRILGFDGALLRIALFLLATYFIFPAIDFILYWFQPEEIRAAVKFSPHDLIRSQFSTVIGFTGLLLILYHYIGRRSKQPFRPVPVMKIFIVGVTLAAIVLCSFSIYQFFTGYSHSPLSAYRPDRQMISGFYRATGFFEHPVPFSGFCLAWFTYFWSLFCYGQTAAKSVFSNLILLIVVLFILMIFLSGSRMPAAIAMSLLIVIPWSITKIRGQKLFVAILAILFIGLLFTWLTGLGSRFLEIASDTEGFGLGERLQFWRVHWSIFWDSPLLGHGHSWLDRYYRSEFYLRLGLGGMEHKYPAHNVFLEVLAQTGFVGFIIIFGGTFLAGVNLKKVFTSANNGVYFWSIRNMFLALGAYGLVQNTFMDTPVAFAVIGLTLISYFVAVLDA